MKLVARLRSRLVLIRGYQHPCDLQISLRRDFQIPLFALDEPDVLPGQFEQLHVVGHLLER